MKKASDNKNTLRTFDIAGLSKTMNENGAIKKSKGPVIAKRRLQIFREIFIHSSYCLFFLRIFIIHMISSSPTKFISIYKLTLRAQGAYGLFEGCRQID